MSKLLFVIGIIALVLSFFLYFSLTEDDTPPTLEVPSTPVVVHCSNKLNLFEQVTALDGDIDISDRVIIENGLLLETKPSFIIYAVSDQNGNVTKKKRSVHYTDQVNISIEQLQKLEFLQSNEAVSFDLSKYFKATDSCGINLTGSLYLEQIPDFSTPGTKSIQLRLRDNNEYQYTDVLEVIASLQQQNNTEIPAHTETPTTFIFKENPVYLPIGSIFSFMTYIQTIEDAVDDFAYLARRVRLTNAPDMNIAGTYVVTYSVKNSRGVDSSDNLMVVVE